MKVKTTLKTLKQVWNLMNEIGLESVFEGKENVKVNFTELVNKLLNENKLNEFLAIVTGENENKFDDMEIKEIVEIVSSFFTVIGAEFSQLAPQISKVNK